MGMVIPPNGIPFYKNQGNILGVGNETPNLVNVFTYQPQTGYELWVKTVGMYPNAAMAAFGNAQLILGDKIIEDPVPVPTTIKLDYDYALVIEQIRPITIGIRGTLTQMVNLQVDLVGLLFPEGTYARVYNGAQIAPLLQTYAQAQASKCPPTFIEYLKGKLAELGINA